MSNTPPSALEALRHVYSEGDLRRAERWLAQDATPFGARDPGSALTTAVTAKDVSVVMHLLSLGADPNGYGGTSLGAAIDNVDFQIVQLLILAGADVNSGSGDDRPVLKAVTVKAAVESVAPLLQLLLDEGSLDLTVKSSTGVTAAAVANRLGRCTLAVMIDKEVSDNV